MRQIVRVGVAVGVLAATSMARIDVAQAAAPGDYYAEVKGQYATVEGAIGGGVLGNLFSGRLTLGELESSLSSSGVGTLNGFATPSGTKAGARGDLVVGSVAGFQLPTDHVQSTAPVASGPATRRYVPVPLGPIIDGGVINGETVARWNGVFKRSAPSQVVTEVSGDTAYLDVLDVSDQLGGFTSLLPKQLQHPVVSLETLRAHTQTATIRNSDGTHGLSAGGIGGLAAIQILGGASHGGITLGLFNNDTGATKDTAGTRVWATGKKGGAGCDYTVPDAVQVAIGSSTVSLPISVGQRINLPAGLGYLDIRFTGTSHCEASADGTYAHATGAGVGISLHLTLPSVPGLPATELGQLSLTLPDLDSATVKVPKGGIPPTDGPGGDGDGDGDGNGDGDGDGNGPGGDNGGDTGGNTVVDTPMTNAVNGSGPVPSSVTSGLAGSTYDVLARWTIPIAAAIALIGAAAWRQWRRLAALD